LNRPVQRHQRLHRSQRCTPGEEHIINQDDLAGLKRKFYLRFLHHWFRPDRGKIVTIEADAETFDGNGASVHALDQLAYVLRHRHSTAAERLSKLLMSMRGVSVPIG